MDVGQLAPLLEDAAAAEAWLAGCGVQDVEAGRAHIVALADVGIARDVLAAICGQVAEILPELADADLALATFARFLAATPDVGSLGALIERDRQSLAVLLRLIATSPVVGDLLAADPGVYHWLRQTGGRVVDPVELHAQLGAEVAGLSDARKVMAALRRFRRRGVLRIAYADIIHRQETEVVSRQLALLADAICEAALQAAWEELRVQRGLPRRRGGQRARFVMLGLGAHGGLELDYGDRLEVMFVHDGDGRSDGSRPIDNNEYFQLLTRKVVRLLGEETELGRAYRVDLKRSPAARQDKHCLSLEATLAHYDTRGRTWERQSLIKARPAAGDMDLGHEFLDAMEPWVYRRYLSRADIAGIKALKRRLERRSHRQDSAIFDVEGGLLDVEFIVQFLQLINGGDSRELRVGNTSHAIDLLEQTGCLTPGEAGTLKPNYDWLRRLEHRLELSHSPPTYSLPEAHDELRRLALQCGYQATGDADLVKRFRHDYEQRIQENQGIINRLLEETFRHDAPTDLETDLVLDPAPSREQVQHVLGPYGFRDVPDAYHHLTELGVERIPFLSTRRCRHFLALISRPLLSAIARTPAPDATLANLCRVSDSLGGKGVLWELFSFHPPSLDLYVRLCAASPYLISILTRYPGMIDELMDSLMLGKLPSPRELQRALDDLCRDAEDIEPILHSFKNIQHLNVGVRELLGKTDIRDATAMLSDVAEACLRRIARQQLQRQVRKYGQPTTAAGDACELVIVAMGKFGGREPNYHSDADVIFLYDVDGSTRHPSTIRNRETTSNQHFFSDLGHRIVKFMSHHGPNGRLYDSHPRLYPTGQDGPYAVSLQGLREYFFSTPRPFAETRLLCQARPVFGSESVRAGAAAVLREILTGARHPHDTDSVRRERLRIQATAGPRNLKRGPGGTVDIEFIVQLLQLRHASRHPEILRSNTFGSLEALERCNILTGDDAAFLRRSYRFLRQVEACLRLLNTSARHDLPREADELAKLAYLMRFESPTRLESECARLARENRQTFDRIVNHDDARD